MGHMAIANRIRAFRKLKGLTQIELSKKINISIAIIGAIERGTRIPDVQILKRISDGLGISFDELTGSKA